MWWPRDILENLFARDGIPREFLTDHGTQFYAVRDGVSTFDYSALKEK